MNKEFLWELLSTGSVSGNEVELEKKLYDYMQDKADQVRVDELGNVTAVLNPTHPSGFCSPDTPMRSGLWSLLWGKMVH